MRNGIVDVVYCFYDEVSGNSMQYYVLPGVEWAERVFKSLVAQIAVGEPREYSFRLVGRFNGLQFISADKVLEECEESAVPITMELRGEDYVCKEVVDNV